MDAVKLRLILDYPFRTVYGVPCESSWGTKVPGRVSTTLPKQLGLWFLTMKSAGLVEGVEKKVNLM